MATKIDNKIVHKIIFKLSRLDIEKFVSKKIQT